MNEKPQNQLALPPVIEIQWDNDRQTHILVQEGKPKLCPYQHEVIPASKLNPNSKPMMGQRPCNTSCALLKITVNHPEPDANFPLPTAPLEPTVKVFLGCSGPVAYEISTKKQENNSPLTTEK